MRPSPGIPCALFVQRADETHNSGTSCRGNASRYPQPLFDKSNQNRADALSVRSSNIDELRSDCRRAEGALPLPACGERVGVRGSLKGTKPVETPFTRIASPRKRGEADLVRGEINSPNFATRQLFKA